MRLIFATLLLVFAVFFTSIGLSSQSGISRSSQGSCRSNIRANAGEETSHSNEHEQSLNSDANSRTGRRHFHRMRPGRLDLGDSASSSLRQPNANRALPGHPRQPLALSPLGHHHGSSLPRREEEGPSGRFEQERFGQQGHFGQHEGQPQPPPDSDSPNSVTSYTIHSTGASFGPQSPRGPLSFHHDFDIDSSQSGSNHGSPHNQPSP